MEFSIIINWKTQLLSFPHFLKKKSDIFSIIINWKTQLLSFPLFFKKKSDILYGFFDYYQLNDSIIVIPSIFLKKNRIYFRLL